MPPPPLRCCSIPTKCHPHRSRGGSSSQRFKTSNIAAAVTATTCTLLLMSVSLPAPHPVEGAYAAAVVPAVRVGLVVSLDGAVAEASQWVIDGYRVAIEEYNQEVANNAATNATSNNNMYGQQQYQHPPINVTIIDTKEVGIFLPTLLDPIMARNDTRLDALGMTIGPQNTREATNVSEFYQLPIFNPLSGERTSFLEQRGALAALMVPIPDAEMAALVKEVVVRRQLRRIAVMTMYGRTYGNDLVPYLRTLLAEFGLELVYHLQMNNSGPPYDRAPVPKDQQLAGLRQSEAQVLFMFAAFYIETGYFIIDVLLALRFNVLIACTTVTSPLLEGVMAALPQGLLANKVITTMYFPLHTDTNAYAVARAYRRAYATYGAAANVTTTLATQDSTKTLAGNFGISGYVVARVLCEVVKAHRGTPVSARSLAGTTFGRQTFMINDVAVGPYSLGCEGALAGTAQCGGPCASGSRAVFLATFDAQRKLVALEGARHELPSGVCIPFGDIVRSPLVQLVALPASGVAWATTEEVEAATLAAAHFARGDAAGYVNATTTPSTRQATNFTLKLLAQGTAELEAEQRNRLITVASGSILSAPLADELTYANLPVMLDPLHVGGAPRLHRKTFSPRTVYLLASLDQEIHALAQAFGPRGIDVMWARAPLTANDNTTKAEAEAATAVAKAVRSSLHTFGHDTMGDVISVASIADGLTARTQSAAGGGVGGGARPLLVLNVRTAADVEALATYAAASSAAASSLASGTSGGELLLPFSTLRLWYGKLLAVLATRPDAARGKLFFASSLPNWSSGNTTTTTTATAAINTTTASSSKLLQEYRDGLTATGGVASPQSLLGFLTQRLVANIAERIPAQLTDASFLRTLYAVSVVVLEAGVFTVGPLSDVPCSSSSGKGSDASTTTPCESNVGARTVDVRSLLSVTPSTAAGAGTTAASAANALSTTVFQSSRVSYHGLPAAVGTSPLVIAFAVVGGVLLLGTVVAIVATRLLSGRNNRAAPKDPSQLFTIIFTDIQSSTSLWAEVPDVMAPALAAHHALIRRLIAKHNGYEVKTIGDAFMVAFKHADDAVRLSHALQLEFMRCPEFSEAIDAAYLSFEHEAIAATAAATLGGGGGDEYIIATEENNNKNNDKNQQLSVHLSPDMYRRLWHGLRVRIGIHTAFGEIQQDATSGGYDYYGTAVNTAARIEAAGHGGQVLMSEGTLAALREVVVTTISSFQGEATTAKAKTANQDGGTEGAAAGESNGNIHHLHSKSSSGPCIVRFMGAVDLRGLTDPVKLYELETVPGRTFPPLRVESSAAAATNADDAGAVIIDGDVASDYEKPASDAPSRPSSMGASSPSTALSSSVFAAAATDQSEVHAMGVLSALVACMPPAGRRTELRRLTDAWRLRVEEVNHQGNKPSNNNSNTNNNNNNNHHTTTITAIGACASAMSHGDARVAASLLALATHLAPIATRIVANAAGRSAAAAGLLDPSTSRALKTKAQPTTALSAMGRHLDDRRSSHSGSHTHGSRSPHNSGLVMMPPGHVTLE